METAWAIIALRAAVPVESEVAITAACEEAYSQLRLETLVNEFGDAGFELDAPHPARWYLRLPRGTQIFDEDNETLLVDLTEIGQRVVLLKGGDGGRGNASYKTSTNRAPRQHGTGWPGEEAWVWLRLKLLAEIVASALA